MGRTTWERSLKKWELQIPCFEEFFWGGNTLGLVPSSRPRSLGYACTLYAPTSPLLMGDFFLFGGMFPICFSFLPFSAQKDLQGTLPKGSGTQSSTAQRPPQFDKNAQRTWAAMLASHHREVLRGVGVKVPVSAVSCCLLPLCGSLGVIKYSTSIPYVWFLLAFTALN